MALTNTIGTESFLYMRGAAATLQQPVEAIDKPGREMSTYRLHATKCETFTVETVVDVSSVEAARNKMMAYRDLKPDGALTFVKEGVTYVEQDETDVEDEIALKVIVLDVKEVGVNAAGCLKGGINVSNGSNGFLLRAQWMLRFVKVDP